MPFAWLSWLVWGSFLAALLIVAADAMFAVAIIIGIAFVVFQFVAKLQRYAWFRHCYSPDRLRGLAGEQEIEITPEHLYESGPNRTVTWKWENYSSIYETLDYVLIYPTPVNSVIIPKKAFSSDAHRSNFVRLVQECIDKKR
jgi:hypothetical protein